MTIDKKNLWIKNLTLFAVLWTFVVVVFGAGVRLSDAGLGCPDWPVCYGHATWPTAQEELSKASAEFGQEVEVPKAWKEQVHRHLASILGVLILILALVFTKGNSLRKVIYLSAVLAIAGTILYIKKVTTLAALLSIPAILIPLGVAFFSKNSSTNARLSIGLLGVTLLLKPVIVLAHLLGGLTILSLLWWLYLRQASPIVSITTPLKRMALIATFVLGIQIALGGWTSTNYAATACPDFPTCQAQWWPKGMDFKEGFTLWRGLGVNYEGGVLKLAAEVAIHFTHRLWAIVTTLFLVLLGIKAFRYAKTSSSQYTAQLKRSAIAMKACLLIQILVAIGMIKMAFPLGISTAHNGFAALLLLATLSVLYFSRAE